MKNVASLLYTLIILSGIVHAQEKAVPGANSAGQPPMSEKEAAFRQFYKRDPACDSFKDDNMMDRCRNAYMAAKKEFEKIWAEKNAGK